MSKNFRDSSFNAGLFVFSAYCFLNYVFPPAVDLVLERCRNFNSKIEVQEEHYNSYGFVLKAENYFMKRQEIQDEERKLMAESGLGSLENRDLVIDKKK